jgi:hypothetical protein
MSDAIQTPNGDEQAPPQVQVWNPNWTLADIFAAGAASRSTTPAYHKPGRQSKSKRNRERVRRTAKRNRKASQSGLVSQRRKNSLRTKRHQKKGN